MIRFLDGLAVLKEVDDIDGVKYSSRQLRKLYPEKVVIIRRVSYIYRDVLCDTARRGVTNMDQYVQMAEFADELRGGRDLFRERISFMRATGENLFDYVIVRGIYYVRISPKMKRLMQHHQPFVARFEDAERIKHLDLLGDLKIGFY